MKKHIGHFALSFFFLFNLFCNSLSAKQTERALLIGDSWAYALDMYDSYNWAFNLVGHGDKSVNGDSTTLSGTTTSYWLAPNNLAKIKRQLIANPTIDIAVVSLGFNDVLTAWNVNFSPFWENFMLDYIQTNLERLVDSIQTVRPGIEVVLMSYDYLNMVETVMADTNGYTALVWKNMHRPTPLQLNTITIRMEQRKLAIALSKSKVKYINSLGVMQYAFGYPTALPVVPFGSFPSWSVTLPAGNYNYPSHYSAMGSLGYDGIHLSDLGYDILALHHTLMYFLEKFSNDSYKNNDNCQTIFPSEENPFDAEQLEQILSSRRNIEKYNMGTCPDVSTPSATLFPNPVAVGNNIQLSDAGSVSYIVIKDLTGRVVERQLGSAEYSMELNTSKLNSGIYFVEIANQIGDSQLEKLIVR